MTIRERIARWLLRQTFAEIDAEIVTLRTMVEADRPVFSEHTDCICTLEIALADTTRELQQLREMFLAQIRGREVDSGGPIRRAAGWNEFAQAARAATDPKRRSS